MHKRRQYILFQDLCALCSARLLWPVPLEWSCFMYFHNLWNNIVKSVEIVIFVRNLFFGVFEGWGWCFYDVSNVSTVLIAFFAGIICYVGTKRDDDSNLTFFHLLFETKKTPAVRLNYAVLDEKPYSLQKKPFWIQSVWNPICTSPLCTILVLWSPLKQMKHGHTQITTTEALISNSSGLNGKHKQRWTFQLE